jgi:hypothetical protein
MTTTTTVDPARCPLCGQANDCRIAAGEATCWCFEAPVPPEVVARVPAEASGVACVCRRCAARPTDEARRRQQGLRWTRR